MSKVGRVLFPPAVRPYITFKSVTVFLVVLYAVAFMLKKMLHIPVERLTVLRAEEQIFYSRAFLVIYNVALAIGFAAIYLTRRNSGIYFRRVVVYGLLLAAVMGELMDVFVPWRI